jgi:hypothetical protein
MLAFGLIAACSPSAVRIEAVDYTPIPDRDWEVSMPEKQGLDPDLLARFYLDAAGIETIRSLLVVKNGYLIVEKYFRDGSID